MAELQHQFFAAGPIAGNIGPANPAIGDEDIRYIRGLRYSSPWPWIFAGVIGLAMWASLASLAWLVWVSVR
jgi:hypothetical protein